MIFNTYCNVGYCELCLHRNVSDVTYKGGHGVGINPTIQGLEVHFVMEIPGINYRHVFAREGA